MASLRRIVSECSRFNLPGAGTICPLVCSMVLLTGSCAYSVTLDWTQQQGTQSFDGSQGVSADGLGNVYISGYTGGALGGPNAGGNDAFLSKYDAAGNIIWSKQLGSSGGDFSQGVSADGLGSVYISGRTYGNLGGPNAGSADAFLSRYDASGALMWTKQLGTSTDDYGEGVSADGLGNVYATGWTFGALGGPLVGSQDAFLFKYNTAGTLLWSRQLGTPVTVVGNSVSADGLGNVYISGLTWGNLGGPNAGMADAFVSKYDAAGNLLWSKQMGSAAHDESKSVSADSLGNVYVSGYTNGNLFGPNAGYQDAFICKFDAAGNLLWSKQIGAPGSDQSWGVSVDGLGNVYFSGTTYDSLAGPLLGNGDMFLIKYDAAGTLLWSKQIGSPGDELATGVSADGLGAVYITGWAPGNGPTAGGYDAFLARLSEPVPEPSTFVLLTGAAAVLFLGRRWKENKMGAADSE
jgi:hypothetical protein